MLQPVIQLGSNFWGTDLSTKHDCHELTLYTLFRMSGNQQDIRVMSSPHHLPYNLGRERPTSLADCVDP